MAVLWAGRAADRCCMKHIWAVMTSQLGEGCHFVEKSMDRTLSAGGLLKKEPALMRLRAFITLFPGVVPALPCGKNRAFVDLGANDGQSLSWFEAELLHRSPTPYTSVTAFEMNPAFEAVLRQTLSRLPAGRLEKAAAWVEEKHNKAPMAVPCCSLPVKAATSAAGAHRNPPCATCRT